MKNYVTVFIAILLSLSAKANAETPLYSMSSKSQGALFDLVVTEIKREPNKSYISVPGFNDRTAPEARWLMCVYTDLALKRGFSYWTVVYPPANSDILVIGLTNTPIITVEGLLGKDYDNERILGGTLAHVEKFFPMCGMRREQ